MSPPDKPVPRIRPDQVRRLKKLSWLLDECIVLPGNIRIGLDGIFGLIPGFGDLLGALLSLYIVFQAKKIGVPSRLLRKMIVNVALEIGVGIVPFFGDLFDFYFKANKRNVALLREYAAFSEAESQLQEVQPKGKGYQYLLLGVLISILLVLLLF